MRSSSNTKTVTKTVKKKVMKFQFTAEQLAVIEAMKKELSELMQYERNYMDLEEDYLCLEAEMKRDEQCLQLHEIDFHSR
jgi:hypothetical protein